VAEPTRRSLQRDQRRLLGGLNNDKSMARCKRSATVQTELVLVRTISEDTTKV
jgi:hypothetical protein